MMGLIPLYAVGSKFLACGDEIATLSAAHLGGHHRAELVAACVWLAHVLVAVSYCWALPRGKVAKEEHELPALWWRLLLVGAWCLVLLAFAIPSVLYALIKSLPSDNTIVLHTGRNAWLVLYFGAPLVNSLLSALLLPSLAEFFSGKILMGAITSKRLQTSADIACNWLAPIAMTVLMNENCMKRWRYFWEKCRSSELDVDMELLGVPMRVLSTEALCSAPPWSKLFLHGHAYFENSGCSRQVVEILAYLLCCRVAVEAVVLPILYLLMWVVSERAEDGTLRLRWLGVETSFTAQIYFIQLEIWAATAVVWGPLVPCLHPLLLLAVAISFVMSRLEVQHFGRKVPCVGDKHCDAEERVSPVFLSLTIVMMCTLLFFFVWETGVTGWWDLEGVAN